MSDIILSIVSIAVGGVLSYWISLHHKPTKNLHHFIKDFDLIDKKQLGLGNELELKFLDRSIDEIRLCRVLLWNSGSECFHRADIAMRDSLRIVAPAAKGLSLVSTYQSRGAIGLSAEISSNSIDVSFDLLDEGDWFELRFIHDRDSDVGAVDVSQPKLVGSIAGVPNGIAYMDIEDNLTERQWSSRVLAASILLLPLGMAFATYSAFQVQKFMNDTKFSLSFVDYLLPYGMLVFAVLTVFISIAYSYSRWKVTNIIVPNSMRKALMK